MILRLSLLQNTFLKAAEQHDAQIAEAGPAAVRPRGRVVRMLMADGQIYEQQDIIVNNTVRAAPERHEQIIQEEDEEDYTEAEDASLLPYGQN